MKPKKKCCANCAWGAKDNYIYLCKKFYYLERDYSFQDDKKRHFRVFTLIQEKIAKKVHCDKHKFKKETK